MNMAADAVAQDDQTGTGVEILDKDRGLVDLDKNNTGTEGDDAQLNDDAPVIDDARAAIYAKHQEKRKEELGDPAPVSLELDDEVTVKVNGKERQVPRSKIEAAGGIEAYQKNAAASELLNQASAEARRVREEAEQLERRRRELDEREQRLSQAAAAKPTAPTELPAAIADAQKSLVRQYHDAMLDGDIDKAGELLIQINAASATTAVNPDDIANRAVQRAKEELTAEQRRKKAEEFEANRLAAVDEFKTKHKDLASNPDAFGLVDSKTLEVHREHPDWDAKAIIDEAANRVRKLIQSVATPSTTDEKLEAKRNRTQVNGGSARVVNRPTPKPQSNSDYVAALRKQRGLDA
jgi:hypothetical protein